MDFEYIEIDTEQVPYRFQIVLGIEWFEMHVRYNELHDYFTVDLFKNGETLVYGEKITYGVPLFSDIYNAKFPGPTIIPLDPSGNERRVTYNNLNKTVFLQVMNK